jgi:hypothetical protein
MYLVTGRAESKPDILGVISTGNDTSGYEWADTWEWRDGSTSISFFDISNPAYPAEVAELELDGYLISSRRVGEIIYLVTRFTPDISGYSTAVHSSSALEENEKLLTEADASTILPSYSVNGSDAGTLVTAENCYLPPTHLGKFSSPDIITVTAININSPTTPSSSCIVGKSESIYVSQESLYLATMTTSYETINVAVAASTTVTASGFTATFVPMIFYSDEVVVTDLHKFALGASNPTYKGSAEVDGHLGWEEDKKSFRMGEYNGHLRIVTSIGESWGDTATTLLTILKEPTDATSGVLEEVSRLPNDLRPESIGKPGELLYAARFLGDRGYLVTFRKTDPLYVLNLSDPADPFIAGELVISGYSDYLHPVGDFHILGIGKEAVADDSGWGDGRGSWHQGLKLSLFDVTDPGNPIETDSMVIGKRGTSSDVLLNHKAVSYIPSIDGAPARLAIPVILHETQPTSSGFDSTIVSALYNWTHTGLYMFELDVTGGIGTAVTLKGKVISEASDGIYYNNRWNTGDNRSVILNDSVHFVYEGQVWSGVWSADPAATGPQ